MKSLKVSMNLKELEDLVDWYEFNQETQVSLDCVVSKLEFNNLHELAIGIWYVYKLLKLELDVFEFPLSFLLTKGGIDGK